MQVRVEHRQANVAQQKPLFFMKEHRAYREGDTIILSLLDLGHLYE